MRGLVLCRYPRLVLSFDFYRQTDMSCVKVEETPTKFGEVLTLPMVHSNRSANRIRRHVLANQTSRRTAHVKSCDGGLTSPTSH